MKVVGLYYASLTTFSAAGVIIYHQIYTGTFPMDPMLELKLLITVFIETEAPALYDFIAETMPQYQMECFTVQFLISMELIKKYMLDYIHWKMVN